MLETGFLSVWLPGHMGVRQILWFGSVISNVMFRVWGMHRVNGVW